MSAMAEGAERPDGTPSRPAESEEREPLLVVRGLRVAFPAGKDRLWAVRGLDLEIRHGERLGVVGESGAGKSVAALSILRLLPDARVEGEVRFDGVDLLGLSMRQLRAVRGRRISLIFQDPLSALNPVMTLGRQITEPLRVRGTSRREADERAIELLERVGLAHARRRLGDYPHQFSGGMRQRVMIAIALVAEPQLVIADEPTTALDVRVQAQVLDLLHELADERRVAVLLITHDLAVVAGFADRVLVMYAGRAAEVCTTEALFRASTHPYTWGLMGALPRLDGPLLERLPTIPGQPPSPARVPPGCPFHPRCGYVQDVCRAEVPELVVHPGDNHPSACHFAGSLPRPSFATSSGPGAEYP
jgi:oligopeptide/dipeptide ABC transporter ATP-binding protein